MKHPLFVNKTIFGLYILAWVMLIGIQTLAFFQLFSVSWFYALMDSLLFGSLYFLIGIGVWYFIRITQPDKNNLLPFALDHLASAIIIVSLWVYGGTYLLSLIFSNSTEYVDLIWSSIAWRYGNGFMFYIILIVVYYLYENNKEEQERKEMEAELRSTLQITEIDLLRSKLNPHFLFNSLNSLNALIQTDTESASRMLIQLADFLRFSIEKDKQEEIAFKEELENLERYMAIEQVRFGDRLKFVHAFQDNALDLKIPAMLMQPLIENTIKYGLGSKLGAIEVYISGKKQAGELVIEIENSYDKSANVKKGSGHGIENVRKRLEMIYKNAAEFSIEKTQDVFKVRILIPQREKDAKT
ncbi:MAG: histidine kinase [Bacteroidales bacterium]|nr:histidine kinase [Bacteroidales bacterium]